MFDAGSQSTPCCDVPPGEATRNPFVTGAVQVARRAAAPPSRQLNPACPYSRGRKSSAKLTRTWCIKPDYGVFVECQRWLDPLVNLFSFRYLWYLRLKQPSEGGWTTRAADPEAENAKRVIHRGAHKRVSDDPTCKTGSDLGLLTDWVSRVFHCRKNISSPGRQALWHIRDKLYPRGRITEGSDQAERKGEKSRREIALCPFLWCLWREEFYPANRRWLWRPLKEQLAVACSLWWA